jgi:hypothetical protein
MKLKHVVAKVAIIGGSVASTAAMAQETIPAPVAALFTSGGAVGALVVTAGIAAYAIWRGPLSAFIVGKRMLSKSGL